MMSEKSVLPNGACRFCGTQWCPNRQWALPNGLGKYIEVYIVSDY